MVEVELKDGRVIKVDKDYHDMLHKWDNAIDYGEYIQLPNKLAVAGNQIVRVEESD